MGNCQNTQDNRDDIKVVVVNRETFKINRIIMMTSKLLLLIGKLSEGDCVGLCRQFCKAPLSPIHHKHYLVVLIITFIVNIIVTEIANVTNTSQTLSSSCSLSTSMSSHYHLPYTILVIVIVVVIFLCTFILYLYKPFIHLQVAILAIF